MNLKGAFPLHGFGSVAIPTSLTSVSAGDESDDQR
jgi:hypothetical protein